MRERSIVVLAVLIVLTVAASRTASADPGWRPLITLGLGQSRMEPFVVGSAECASAGFGLTEQPSHGAITPRFEIRALHGRDFRVGVAPEASNAGQQTLVLATAGCDASLRQAQPFFVTSRLGLGHSWIRYAHGPIRSPDLGIVRLQDHFGVGYAFGCGMRLNRNSNEREGRISLRCDGLLRSALSSWAYAVTLEVGTTL